ncbi:MAG: energy transducer TonB, partial [Victivallaceae bacterium]|nr:energy transducer TonB [Victivallaceae bacterium]
KLQPITDSQWQEMNRPKTPPENRNVSRTGPQGKPGDNQEGEKFRLGYGEYVGKYLEDKWDPPSILQLGGHMPEVEVRIWLSTTGAITKWQLLKSSGFTVVDNSVIRLFRDIRKLPHPPPKGLSDLTLILVVKPKDNN